MSDEVTKQEIADLAKGPKKLSGDEGMVEERSMEDVIAGDRYAKSQGATKPPFGMRIARIRFPGTT